MSATRLVLRVQPGASRSALCGRLADGRIKVRIAAPAEGGRANEALRALLAETLGVRVAAIRLVAGAGSRDKIVEVDAPAEHLKRLDAKAPRR